MHIHPMVYEIYGQIQQKLRTFVKACFVDKRSTHQIIGKELRTTPAQKVLWQ